MCVSSQETQKQTYLILECPINCPSLRCRISIHIAQRQMPTDAPSVLWSQKDYYAFPPICLILRVLSKILREQVHSVILITPCWQTLQQYLKDLSLLVNATNPPRLLVYSSWRSNLLVLNNILTQVAWKVSGKNCLTQEFLKKQPNLLPDQEEPVLWQITNPPRKSDLSGAINGKMIHFNILDIMFYNI